MLLSTQWAFTVIEGPLQEPGDTTRAPKGLATLPLSLQIAVVSVPFAG